MIVGVPRESFPGETRVGLVPMVLPQLTKNTIEVLVESGAGDRAGFTDEAFRSKGAKIVGSRQELFQTADVIVQVRTLGANPDEGRSDLELLRDGQTVIGTTEPLTATREVSDLAQAGVRLLALELMPRITRAQNMDVLSSMATIAGYKGVLLAATHLPRMFPMMMTAAGTLKAARCFVVGAGVAGLQAIASARRLGAVVEAYDVRPAVKEQVESLGAKFVELDLETSAAEDSGGYATELGDEFYRRQREMMAEVVRESDVVVTTAAVPGKTAPILVTREMVEGMKPGSVIMDLAAERGGNCEVTQTGETVEVAGVSVVGPVNLPATVPYHASQMFAKNVTAFLLHLVEDGELVLDTEDEITAETLVTRDGEVVHARVREAISGGRS